MGLQFRAKFIQRQSGQVWMRPMHGINRLLRDLSQRLPPRRIRYEFTCYDSLFLRIQPPHGFLDFAGAEARSDQEIIPCRNAIPLQLR